MTKSVYEPFEKDSSKARIFREAVTLFSQKGYNGVSMRELSQRTGLSKPTIYYHFGNKEGIYKTLVETVLRFNTQLFEDIIREEMSYKEKMITLARLRFRQVTDYPELAKFFLVLFTQPEKLPFLEKYVDEAMKRRKLLIDLLKEGIASGEFGPRAKPEMAAELFVAAITHFTWKQLNSEDKILSDSLAEEIVNTLFLGINE